MSEQTLKELQLVAKQKGLYGWYRMDREELIRTINADDKKLNTVTSNRCEQFLASFNNAEETRAPYLIMREQYVQLFSCEPPLNQPFELCKSKVAYQLLIDDYAKTNTIVSEKLAKNYKAAQSFHIDAFDKGMKQLLNITIKTTNEEEVMSANKKQSKNSNGRTISSMKKIAREKKIRGWYAMTAAELEIVLASSTSAEQRSKTEDAAMKRYVEYNAKYQKVTSTKKAKKQKKATNKKQSVEAAMV